MRHLRFVLVALAIGAWAAGPLPGAAASVLAPTYQSSEPSKGAMMDEPPSEVTVTFSEPLDPSSWMSVFDECGNEIDGGDAAVQLNEMTVPIAKTPSGTYEVVYRAVGVAGATGTSNSTFDFMVHNGKPCGGAKGGHHHPKPGKGKGKHGGHREPGNGGNGHGGHDGGGDGGAGSGHSGGHSGMTGTSGSSGHSGHDMGGTTASGGGHGKHGGGRHGGGSTRPGTGDEPPTLAGGTGDVPVGADAEAVLIGLGLALAVGVLGGWLLRMSGNLTHPA